MSNFSMNFSHPWLLLLLIAALAFSLIPHFRVSKKYRRNRTRITSLVLHLIVLFLSIFLLSGMRFDYTLDNDQNEIILLVDCSDSEEDATDKRDEFVETALDYIANENAGYNVGVVTFGFDQEYAVPLTKDVDGAYSTYVGANLPDTSATDIAAALNYTKTLFNHPETGKIILATDGKETDEEALNVIRSISANGIRVDTCYFDTTFSGSDIQIVDIKLPDYHVNVNEECTIEFTVQSTEAAEITAVLSDNDVEDKSAIFNMAANGTATFELKHTFTEDSLHDICISVSTGADSIDENNEYHTYINIIVFNKVLIIERAEGESDALVDFLRENDVYDVEILNINTALEIPETVDGLRIYDQIILNNIANKDLPDGFDAILNEYVYDFGGGLFTVGGDDERGNANAYNRSDLYGTLLQEMLPVQAINYTPPVGLIVIIDKSGSMSSSDGSTGKNLLELAGAGASSCLDSLSERDYMGIMTLESEYGVVLPLTPRTQEAKIRAAIDSIGSETAGGTVFFDSIERAAQQLAALTSVDKKHIIIITDGMPADQTDPETGNKIYEDLIEKIYNVDRITTSIVLLGTDESSSTATTMRAATDKGHGNLYALKAGSALVAALRDDLSAPEITEQNFEEFYPSAANIYSSLLVGVDRQDEKGKESYLTFSLGGFYGVKLKSNAELVLEGSYGVPIYAQWKYGTGMVGSLMVDLNNNWGTNLLSDTNGQQLLRNIINNLMPVEDISPNEITVNFSGENYINQMSIFANIEEGQTITGTLTNLTDPLATALPLITTTDSKETLREKSCYVSLGLSPDNNYSRCTFVVKEAGLYEITLNKLDAAGAVLATYTTYKSFSYSKEYDIYVEEADLDYKDLVDTLADRGNGEVIEAYDDPVEILHGFITEINKTFDPRILFMILVLILFLLDIAVRKFKFKWPHEIIRDYKEKKNNPSAQ